MTNDTTIVQIALGLAMIAVAIFLLTQPAAAAHSEFATSHGSSLVPSGANSSGPSVGDTGGIKRNPVVHPNVKPIKTERGCQRNCAKGGMNRDFCLLACAGY